MINFKSKINVFVGVSLMIFLLASCALSPQKENTKINTPLNENRVAIVDKPLNIEQTAQLKAAVDDINNSNIKSAKKILKTLYNSVPSNKNIAANYALVAFKMGDDELVNTILAKDQRSPLSLNILGLQALKDNRPGDAEKFFQKAIQIDDKYAQAHYNLALVHDTYYQDLSSAIKYYQSYLVLTNFEDKKTQQWVEELEASVSRENR